MIDLRECIIQVQNKKEYKAIVKIAMEQGFEWGDGDPLTAEIPRDFPIRLWFTKNYCTYYDSCIGCHTHDCFTLINGIRKLITIRQKRRAL